VRGLSEGPLEIRAGRADCALVSTSSILKVALDAAAKLATQGLEISVYSLPWLQPVTADFLRPLTRYARVVALEEHLTTGGLAALLREHLPSGISVASLALPPGVLSEVGSQDYLRRRAGLDAETVMARLLEWLHPARGS
jgi:1-deoxy-D-xylulose-5-phosphate synthase